MPDQMSLALPPSGSAQWVEQALPDARTVDALAGLNRDFLELAARLVAARPDAPPLGLPRRIAGGLARAQATLGAALRLPFALFDLRFRDGRYWQSQAAAAVAVRDGGAGAATAPGVQPFTRNALTFAWHLVQRDAAAAGLALGLESGTARAIGELPVGALEGLARRTAPVLAARFCKRELFWELLLEEPAGRAPGAQRLARLRLLGQQLQGMEAARARQLHRRARRSAQAQATTNSR